ncbi:MAG: class I SAM-dependent methyltransferase family protein, partial [Methanosarcinales archaeon]|nr:class I SAM-dependent methyltransferase family protein [Methanosarcinales archaeon]
ADAFQAAGMLRWEFDRAIIPTPYGQDLILPAIYPLVRTGGTIYFYTFKKKFQIQGLVREFWDMGLKTVFFRRCGNVAPGVSRYAFDLVKTEK